MCGGDIVLGGRESELAGWGLQYSCSPQSTTSSLFPTRRIIMKQNRDKERQSHYWRCINDLAESTDHAPALVMTQNLQAPHPRSSTWYAPLFSFYNMANIGSTCGHYYRVKFVVIERI